VNNLEEKSNQILDYFCKSSHIAKNENDKSNFQAQDLRFSYTPDEDILRSKFENEIEEPPPPAQEYLILVTYDEKPQKH
jgi:hypothetical protein